MAELSNTEISLNLHIRPSLQNQKHVHLGQLDKSSLDNTCLGSGAWQGTSTCNSLTCQGYHTRHWTTFVHAWGLNKLVTLLFVKATTPDIIQSSTLDNLFRPQVDSKLGGLMYCPRSTKYMWHPTWHTRTCVHPPCQLWHKSTYVRPLAIGLPTNRLSLTS